MKYSETCLNKALDLVLIGRSTWGISTPKALSMAAEHVFMYPDMYDTDYNLLVAVEVIRHALIELSTAGWITFGDTDEL